MDAKGAKQMKKIHLSKAQLDTLDALANRVKLVSEDEQSPQGNGKGPCAAWPGEAV